jgi:hypothetical protein
MGDALRARHRTASRWNGSIGKARNLTIPGTPMYDERNRRALTGRLR